MVCLDWMPSYHSELIISASPRMINLGLDPPWSSHGLLASSLWQGDLFKAVQEIYLERKISCLKPYLTRFECFALLGAAFLACQDGPRAWEGMESFPDMECEMAPWDSSWWSVAVWVTAILVTLSAFSSSLFIFLSTITITMTKGANGIVTSQNAHKF